MSFVSQKKNESIPSLSFKSKAIAVSLHQHLETFLIVYPPPPTSMSGTLKPFTYSTQRP